MSVISTLITRSATIHATDSLITQLLSNGTRKPLEWTKTKITPVHHWRGAMSYWGLAKFGNWSTLEWLRNRASESYKFSSPQAFAEAIALGLNTELAKFTFKHSLDAGVGIHFTAYEDIESEWVPELFAITNFFNTAYDGLKPSGVGVARGTYSCLSNQEPSGEDGQEHRRLQVVNGLREGRWLRFNNGDPLLYNPAAAAILEMANRLANRRLLRDPDDIETLRSLARLPVKMVAEIQRDFCSPNHQIVGGKIHDLVITPLGIYSSKSGDK